MKKKKRTLKKDYLFKKRNHSCSLLFAKVLKTKFGQWLSKNSWVLLYGRSKHVHMWFYLSSVKSRRLGTRILIRNLCHFLLLRPDEICRELLLRIWSRHLKVSLIFLLIRVEYVRTILFFQIWVVVDFYDGKKSDSALRLASNRICWTIDERLFFPQPALLIFKVCQNWVESTVRLLT